MAFARPYRARQRPPEDDNEPTPFEGGKPKSFEGGPCASCNGVFAHELDCPVGIEQDAEYRSAPRRIALHKRYLPGYDPAESLREEADAWDAAGRPDHARRCRAVAAKVDEMVFMDGPTPAAPPAKGMTAREYLALPMPIEKPTRGRNVKKTPASAKDDLFAGNS